MPSDIPTAVTENIFETLPRTSIEDLGITQNSNNSPEYIDKIISQYLGRHFVCLNLDMENFTEEVKEIESQVVTGRNEPKWDQLFTVLEEKATEFSRKKSPQTLDMVEFIQDVLIESYKYLVLIFCNYKGVGENRYFKYKGSVVECPKLFLTYEDAYRKELKVQLGSAAIYDEKINTPIIAINLHEIIQFCIIDGSLDLSRLVGILIHEMNHVANDDWDRNVSTGLKEVFSDVKAHNILPKIGLSNTSFRDLREELSSGGISLTHPSETIGLAGEINDRTTQGSTGGRALQVNNFNMDREVFMDPKYLKIELLLDILSCLTERQPEAFDEPRKKVDILKFIREHPLENDYDIDLVCNLIYYLDKIIQQVSLQEYQDFISWYNVNHKKDSVKMSLLLRNKNYFWDKIIYLQVKNKVDEIFTIRPSLDEHLKVIELMLHRQNSALELYAHQPFKDSIIGFLLKQVLLNKMESEYPNDKSLNQRFLLFKSSLSLLKARDFIIPFQLSSFLLSNYLYVSKIDTLETEDRQLLKENLKLILRYDPRNYEKLMKLNYEGKESDIKAFLDIVLEAFFEIDSAFLVYGNSKKFSKKIKKIIKKYDLTIPDQQPNESLTEISIEKFLEYIEEDKDKAQELLMIKFIHDHPNKGELNQRVDQYFDEKISRNIKDYKDLPQTTENFLFRETHKSLIVGYFSRYLWIKQKLSGSVKSTNDSYRFLFELIQKCIDADVDVFRNPYSDHSNQNSLFTDTNSPLKGKTPYLKLLNYILSPSSYKPEYVLPFVSLKEVADLPDIAQKIQPELKIIEKLVEKKLLNEGFFRLQCRSKSVHSLILDIVFAQEADIEDLELDKCIEILEKLKIISINFSELKTEIIRQVTRILKVIIDKNDPKISFQEKLKIILIYYNSKLTTAEAIIYLVDKLCHTKAQYDMVQNQFKDFNEVDDLLLNTHTILQVIAPKNLLKAITEPSLFQEEVANICLENLVTYYQLKILAEDENGNLVLRNNSTPCPRPADIIQQLKTIPALQIQIFLKLNFKEIFENVDSRFVEQMLQKYKIKDVWVKRFITTALDNCDKLPYLQELISAMVAPILFQDIEEELTDSVKSKILQMEEFSVSNLYSHTVRDSFKEYIINPKSKIGAYYENVERYLVRVRRALETYHKNDEQSTAEANTSTGIPFVINSLQKIGGSIIKALQFMQYFLPIKDAQIKKALERCNDQNPGLPLWVVWRNLVTIEQADFKLFLDDITINGVINAGSILTTCSITYNCTDATNRYKGLPDGEYVLQLFAPNIDSISKRQVEEIQLVIENYIKKYKEDKNPAIIVFRALLEQTREQLQLEFDEKQDELRANMAKMQVAQPDLNMFKPEQVVKVFRDNESCPAFVSTPLIKSSDPSDKNNEPKIVKPEDGGDVVLHPDLHPGNIVSGKVIDYGGALPITQEKLNIIEAYFGELNENNFIQRLVDLINLNLGRIHITKTSLLIEFPDILLTKLAFSHYSNISQNDLRIFGLSKYIQYCDRHNVKVDQAIFLYIKIFFLINKEDPS